MDWPRSMVAHGAEVEPGRPLIQSCSAGRTAVVDAVGLCRVTIGKL
ncbi:MAG: hypothetical protein KDJ52_22270 [Anaerolineae bacterium]|nr:hypothetical protein [Anaerolineae bacterium]